MKRVRFAPSPTGSLHVGNALSAVAAAPLGERFDGITLLRPDGTATFHLASVVDDGDFGITHVVRGNDHRPNEPLHRRLHEALGTRAPEYVHHGLIIGADGKKLSKRAEKGPVTVARFRELRERANGDVSYETAKSLVRELKAVGGDLHALRLALTGRDRG